MKLETASFLEISQLLKHSDRSLEELLSFTFESSPFAVFILRLIEEDNVPVDYEYVYIN